MVSSSNQIKSPGVPAVTMHPYGKIVKKALLQQQSSQHKEFVVASLLTMPGNMSRLSQVCELSLLVL